MNRAERRRAAREEEKAQHSKVPEWFQLCTCRCDRCSTRPHVHMAIVPPEGVPREEFLDGLRRTAKEDGWEIDVIGEGS